MDKQDVLDTIDSLVASIRRSEDDISNLRDNIAQFTDDYLWEFVDAY